MRNSVIVMSIVAVGLSMGARDANARIITATETTGQVPSDFTSLMDNIEGVLCNANEDMTACHARPYTVNSSLISPAFQATGGAAAVNLRDSLGSSDTPNNLSDQLYLTVSAPIGGLYTLTWCWDSDLEPHVNICTIPSGTIPVDVVEPLGGFTDLTSFFTGPNGPLAAGQWTIQAQSEVPEPTSLLLIGFGLFGLKLVHRMRTVR